MGGSIIEASYSSRAPEANQRSREWPLVAVVILVAFAARGAWALAVKPQSGLFDDAGYYDHFARSIAAGNGYRMPWGTPTAFWPVGYPAVLGAVYFVFGPGLSAAKLLNCVLGAVTAGLTYVLGRQSFTRPQAATGALLFAIMPGSIGFVSLTLSETLFTMLFVLMVLVFATAPKHRRDLLMIGALGSVIAAATLVRGQAALMPLVAVPWLLLQGWRKSRAYAFSAITLALVAVLCLPWSVRNSITFHTPLLLSTNLGVNLWAGHHAGADGGLDFGQQVEFAARFADLDPLEQEPAENREGWKEALDFAIGHPGQEAVLSGKKVAHLYQEDTDALRWNEHNGDAPIFSDTTRTRLTALFNASYYICGVLALAALCTGLLHRQAWAQLLALVTLYWTAVHVVFFAEPRFHAPLLPLIALLGGVAVVSAIAFARGRLQALLRRRPGAAGATVLENTNAKM